MLKITNLQNDIFGPVTLELDSGQSMVVSGPSGSGKTRFLRAICDLDPADGDVALDGHERQQVSAYEWRQQVRYVPAESFWWHETVGQHFDPTVDLAQMMEALDLNMKLKEWPISKLSTGERQRLAFIRSITDNPKVLLLDEPTSALDDQRTKLVEQMINAQLELGKIILIASHSQSQSEKYGPKCIHFENGKPELRELEKQADEKTKQNQASSE